MHFEKRGPWAALVPLIALALAACVSTPAPPSPPAPKEEDIHALIERGDAEAIRGKLNARELANGKGGNGDFPLHAAVRKGDVAIVKWLVENAGAAVDPKDAKGRTPLNLALETGAQECAAYLASRGASLWERDESGTTPASRAMASGKETLSAILGKSTKSQKSPDGTTLLHLAAEAGSEPLASFLLGRGADPHARDARGRTALDVALEAQGKAGSCETAETLARRGATSSLPEFAYFTRAARSGDYHTLRLDDGSTPLHEAVRRGHRGIAAFLLSRGSLPNAKNSSGSTPLHEAALAGDAEMIALLVGAGGSPKMADGLGNAPIHISPPEGKRLATLTALLAAGADPNQKDRRGNTALHVAATLGWSIAEAQAVIDAGAALDAANADGDTALSLAVARDNERLCSLLVSRGASIFSLNAKGEHPLRIAFARGGKTAAALISEKTAGLRDDSGNTPLLVACALGERPETVSAIMAAGADPNAQNNSGDTALHECVRRGLRAQGEIVLSAGGDVFRANKAGEMPLTLALADPGKPVGWLFASSTLKARDGMGDTAIHHMARLGFHDLIPAIAEKGADLEARNANGETPLFSAVRANLGESVSLLVRIGANPEARDLLGNTPYHAAVAWNAPKAMQALPQTPRFLDSVNFSGKTPLHEAARRGNAPFAKYLIERGCPVDSRDGSGNTPLHDAVKAKRREMAELLLQSGAFIESRDDSGATPLLAAVRGNDGETASMLSGRGAGIHAADATRETPFIAAIVQGQGMLDSVVTRKNVDSQDPLGRTALHVVCEAKPSSDIAAALLFKKASTELRDFEGRTPLMAAIRSGAFDVAETLLGNGADPFAGDKDGETPARLIARMPTDLSKRFLNGKTAALSDRHGTTFLHAAAQAGNAEAARLLLGAGADPTAMTITGDTPLSVAKRRGDKAVISILEQAGKVPAKE